jgi:hypothetical protein
MKKVFSRERFLEVEQRDDPENFENDAAANWPYEFDGKTEVECRPYMMDDAWMIEWRIPKMKWFEESQKAVAAVSIIKSLAEAIPGDYASKTAIETLITIKTLSDEAIKHITEYEKLYAEVIKQEG